MRYIIREKFFRLGEDSTITDESGQPVIQVDGKVLSLHHTLVLRDMRGNELATVKKKLIALGQTYVIARQGQDQAWRAGRRRCLQAVDFTHRYLWGGHCSWPGRSAPAGNSPGNRSDRGQGAGREAGTPLTRVCQSLCGALCWLLGISVLEQAARRNKEVDEREKVAGCVCLSYWSSCGSSDARRFRDRAQDSSQVLGMSFFSSLAHSEEGCV